MHVFFRAKLESDLVMFSFFAAELTEHEEIDSKLSETKV